MYVWVETELDRMHHETDLGEHACMFFHAKKLPCHAREFSGIHIIGHHQVGRKDLLNVFAAYLSLHACLSSGAMAALTR